MRGPGADAGEPSDPAEAAARYADAGADEIHVRADGAAGAVEAAVQTELARRIASAVRIPLAVQTQLETDVEIGGLLAAGAARVTILRQALRDPDRIAELVGAFGPEAVAVAIVARREGDHWRVLDGASGAETEWDAFDWARVVESQGGGEVVVAAAGGAERGVYDLDLLGALARVLHIPVLADGEPEGAEPVFDALMLGDADGVRIGELFRSGRTSPRELKAYLAEHGLEVRGA